MFQCVNIFFLLQNYDDPIAEYQQNINRTLGAFGQTSDSIKESFGSIHDAPKINFHPLFNSLIPPSAIRELRIGRMITLVRSSINLLSLIPLMYGAFRFNSLSVLIGFIYWCTQSIVGWYFQPLFHSTNKVFNNEMVLCHYRPSLYYYTGAYWDSKMIWEVVITIKLELCFAVVSWGCYKHVELRKSEMVDNNP